MPYQFDAIADWLWANVPNRPMNMREIESLTEGLINGPLTRLDVIAYLVQEAESRGRVVR